MSADVVDALDEGGIEIDHGSSMGAKEAISTDRPVGEIRAVDDRDAPDA